MGIIFVMVMVMVMVFEGHAEQHTTEVMHAVPRQMTVQWSCKGQHVYLKLNAHVGTCRRLAKPSGSESG